MQPLSCAETALKKFLVECEKQTIYTTMVIITRHIKGKATEKCGLKV